MSYKSFTPKVDTKRRLVMTRFYAGIRDSNNFCYQINRITKTGTVDKRFKPLFAFGFTSVKCSMLISLKPLSCSSIFNFLFFYGVY